MSGDGTVGDEVEVGTEPVPALQVCSVDRSYSFSFALLHSTILWRGTELEKSVQSSLLNVHAGCC